MASPILYLCRAESKRSPCSQSVVLRSTLIELEWTVTMNGKK